MKILIAIPTYKRNESLNRCLKSVEKATEYCSNHQFVTKVFFNDMKDRWEFMRDYGEFEGVEFHILGNEEYTAPTFWNNRLKDMKEDALCYLNDDIQLFEDCLYEAIKSLQILADDGLVGFSQDNAMEGQACQSAFGLLSSTFADRFPNREVFCPDYKSLYIDSELGEYAKSVSRFLFDEKAKLIHYHPSFTGVKPDETHKHNRKNLDMDKQTYKLRQAKRLLWGRDLERVR